MSLSQEQVPASVKDEELREFLNRRFIDVGVNFANAPKFPTRKEMPYKPQNGDVHYFGDPATHQYSPEIEWEGWWGYLDGTWVPIDSAKSVRALYGGMRLSAPVAFIIDTTWRDIIFDDGIAINPVGVIQDTANNALLISDPAVWRFSTVITFFHDIVAGNIRVIELRVLNKTTGLATQILRFATGRNADITSISASSLEDLLLVVTTAEIVIQVRSDDVYSAVTLEESNFSVNSVSALLG